AEEEKAKAAVLAIRRASDERKAKEMAEGERRRLEAEARERIGMFEEVLEIEPDDPLATFGMGKAYAQLNQHAQAIPFFARSTQLQKDYSVAWLNLGQCHEIVGNWADAVSAYRAGIEAATRKGDLMPLREMERRLKSLQAHVAN
ncbi:MAG: tetratricopeptide repeat protein, partial [Candidatus Hydrogenedentales bacterium]